MTQSFFRNSASRRGVADAGNECPVRGSAARPVRVTMRKERDRPNLGRRIDGQTTRPNDHRRSYHSALFGRLTHTPLSGANVGGNNIRVSNFVLEAVALFFLPSLFVEKYLALTRFLAKHLSRHHSGSSRSSTLENRRRKRCSGPPDLVEPVARPLAHLSPLIPRLTVFRGSVTRTRTHARCVAPAEGGCDPSGLMNRNKTHLDNVVPRSQFGTSPRIIYYPIYIVGDREWIPTINLDGTKSLG